MRAPQSLLFALAVTLGAMAGCAELHDDDSNYESIPLYSLRCVAMVEPEVVDFGGAATPVTRQLAIHNIGPVDFRVYDLFLTGTDVLTFSDVGDPDHRPIEPSTPFRVDAGQSFVIGVTLVDEPIEPLEATLIARTNCIDRQGPSVLFRR